MAQSNLPKQAERFVDVCTQPKGNVHSKIFRYLHFRNIRRTPENGKLDG